jgi:glycosyltransferase involved in cell wall biosynthesis
MESKQHKLLYASSYDRGLSHLLKLWPKILERFPDTTLDVAYGWDLFLKGFQNNPERMAWKKKIDDLMTQPRITHHGRVSKEELNKITSECGIWAYPTDFDEINCITALNCQSLGCVPCVINKAALKETVGSGVQVEGEIWDPDVREEYLKQLLDLMGDEKRWQEESKKGIEFAKDYSWTKISKQWVKEF